MNKRQKQIGIISLLAVAGFLLPTHFTHAEGWFGLPTITDLIYFFLKTIFDVIGKFMAIVAQGLNYAIRVRAGGDIPVVKATWKILRDFSNMIFIVILIYMAFATIFNHGNYTFQKMIARFVIVAVLINFSLVIGNLVIDFSQVLTNIFLASIGNLGDRLGAYLSPAALLPSKINGTDTALTLIVSTAFALILAAIFLFNMIVAMTFAIIRIPFIWGLLIVSPFAWMAHILPSSETWWKKWWSMFLGWNLFLPVYLFFMYLGLLFLSKRNEVLTAVVQINPASGVNPVNQPLFGLIGTQNLTFNLLFFYIFAAVVMVGGLWAAQKVTSMFGTGFDKGVGWAREFGHNVWPYTQVRPAIQAAKDRLAQVQQEGIPGPLNKLWRGQEGYQRDVAKWSNRVGVRGADLKFQKSFVDLAGKDYVELERQFQDGKITIEQIKQNAPRYKATDPKGFAYRKLAAKVGQLDKNLFISTLTQLSKNPYAAQDFVKTAKEGKFSAMKGGDLAKMAAAAKGVDDKGVAYDYSALETNIGARREMYRYVQTDTKAASGLGYKEFEAGLELFGGHTTAEGKAYLKEMGKVSPDFVADYNLAHPDQKALAVEGYEKAHGHLPSNDFRLKVQMLIGSLKSGDVKTTANIKLKTWQSVPEFSEALKVYLSQLSDSARKSYINRLEKAILDTDGGDKKLEILYRTILDPLRKPTKKPISEPPDAATTIRI